VPEPTPPHAISRDERLTPAHFNEKYAIKDSGQREVFASGMNRDVQTDKTLYSLVYDGPMLDRWAVHLTSGAKKYAARNWMKASGVEEMDRFRESAARHFRQWMAGDQDEDHAAAVMFNLNGYEYVKARLAHGPDTLPEVQRG
jgi:hypothetical protein